MRTVSVDQPAEMAETMC